jgi:hypothetical protein
MTRSTIAPRHASLAELEDILATLQHCAFRGSCE